MASDFETVFKALVLEIANSFRVPKAFHLAA